jgi:tryptophanyl-tRNA synthetase
MNDESRPKAAHVNLATRSETTVPRGNDRGHHLRCHRRVCRQLDDLLGVEHYPHPDDTVPAVSMREVAA